MVIVASAAVGTVPGHCPQGDGSGSLRWAKGASDDR